MTAKGLEFRVHLVVEDLEGQPGGLDGRAGSR